MNNDGKTTRDYVFVRDVVSACIAAADSTACEIVNIGTAQQTSTEALLAMIEEAAGVSSEHAFRKDVADEVKHCALAIEKARTLFDWAPNTSLKAGIEETVAWYRERL